MKQKPNELKDQGFYHSSSWRKLRRLALQRDNYLCQHCLQKGVLRMATEVHHVKPIADYPELALSLDNLISLCWPCHEQTKEHRRAAMPSLAVRAIKISADGDESIVPDKQ